VLYISQIILEFIFMIFCGLTNPLVCLFADEYGWLPECLKFWQTYDNTLDVGWMVTEEGHIPNIFKYDYAKHYIYHFEDKSAGQLKPGWVALIDPNFTIKEKIQRYFCRLCWLYRNCNYGFSYYFNGRDYNGLDNIVVVKSQDSINETWLSYIDNGSNIFKRTWCLYIVRQWCSKFTVRIYLGWKLKHCTEPYNARAMIAMHVNLFTKIN